MNLSIIYAFAWAGLVMLFNYCMWKGNVLSWYYEWLEERKYRIAKVFGLCDICFGFWFGIPFYYVVFRQINNEYLIFLGISEMILIFYHVLKLNKK